ncbi:MAG: hypothetical protein OXC98_05015 [bacterium]|nr:hypothetical protein [bacterium]
MTLECLLEGHFVAVDVAGDLHTCCAAFPESYLKVRSGRTTGLYPLPFGVAQSPDGLDHPQSQKLLRSPLFGFTHPNLGNLPACRGRVKDWQAARKAIGGEVAVDTSVVVMGVASELDTPGLGARFKSVLVADELVNDARAAILWAREPVEGFAGYDSLSDRLTFTQIDQAQRQAIIEKAEKVSETLNGWQKIRSGHLSPSDRHEAAERLKPWGASLLVAISRGGCALWCDDLALRTLADQWDIPTFGTWALLEALSSDPENPLPGPTTETKMRLLKAQIADVPISLEELTLAAGDTHDDRIAVNSFLARPRIWVENPQIALAWALHRVTELHSGPHRQRVSGLVQAACYGWGTAAPPPARNAVVGSVLGGAILTVGDPATIPNLVTAARYAAHEIDPTGTLDPLPEAVKNMLNYLEASTGSGPAAQTLTLLFSEANPDDRRVVVSILLDDR